MPVELWPNLAAEEGRGWRRHQDLPEVARLRAGWERLVVGDWRLAALGTQDGLVPWLADDEARDAAKARGLTFAGADPEVVGVVHHKAFTRRVNDELDLEPAPLAGLMRAYPADVLEDLSDDDVSRAIREVVSSWPPWTEGRFMLKPGIGTSGRGRVGGRGALDERGVSSLRRFRRRGGFVLEPWLERLADFSAQFVVEADRVVCLGTTSQDVSGPGVYLGNRGVIDAHGRPHANVEHAERLEEVGALLADAARAAGYRGACGVDSFTFVGPGGAPCLRPAVELNARFTGGTVLVGALMSAVAAGRAKPKDLFVAAGGAEPAITPPS